MCKGHDGSRLHYWNRTLCALFMVACGSRSSLQGDFDLRATSGGVTESMNPSHGAARPTTGGVGTHGPATEQGGRYSFGGYASGGTQHLIGGSNNARGGTGTTRGGTSARSTGGANDAGNSPSTSGRGNFAGGAGRVASSGGVAARGGSSGVGSAGSSQGAGTTSSAGTAGTTTTVRQDACVESMCTSGGWCWVHPSPQGNSLYDVALSDGVLWAVGSDGLVLRYENGRWLRCPTPTTERLTSIWVAPNEQLWVTSEQGSVLSFEGSVWTTRFTAPGSHLSDIHGTASNDIWAVGGDTLLHFDGRTWTRLTLSNEHSLQSVWVAAKNDVWLGGTYAWHFDGNNFAQRYDSPLVVKGIWGDGNGTVWMAATGIVRCDAIGCKIIDSPSSQMVDVWGSSPTDVWMIGLTGGMHWNGNNWSNVPGLSNPTALTGGSPYGVVAASSFGNTLQLRDGVWRDLGARLDFAGWHDIWGFSDDDVWFVGGSAAHYDGKSLQVVKHPSDAGLTSIHGIAPNDIWAAGWSGGIFHYDGNAWTDYSIPNASASSPTMQAIWARDQMDVWTVTTSGLAYHYDGSAWTQQTTPGKSSMRALFGLGGALWSSSDAGALWRWDGNAWDRQTAYSSQRANAIWGSSANDLWIAGAGANAQVTHVTAEGNSRVEFTEIGELTGIWGSSPTDVWAIGNDHIFHFDGQAWAEMPSGIDAGTAGIWIAPSGTRFVAGNGAVLRHAP